MSKATTAMALIDYAQLAETARLAAARPDWSGVDAAMTMAGQHWDDIAGDVGDPALAGQMGTALKAAREGAARRDDAATEQALQAARPSIRSPDRLFQTDMASGPRAAVARAARGDGAQHSRYGRTACGRRRRARTAGSAASSGRRGEAGRANNCQSFARRKLSSAARGGRLCCASRRASHRRTRRCGPFYQPPLPTRRRGRAAILPTLKSPAKMIG